MFLQVFAFVLHFFRIFGNVVGLESVSPRGYVGCSKLYIICLAAPSALDWGDKCVGGLLLVET